jgi:hypothetical protein
MGNRVGLARKFLGWSTGICLLVYCLLGLLFGAWPFLFYPQIFLICFGAMLPGALAGAAYLYLMGSRAKISAFIAVLAGAAVLPVMGYYLWLLSLEPLSASYAGIVLYPMIGGGLVTAFVAALIWPKLG